VNLNLIARLAALERRHPPPAGPFCVQIMVLHDGTTVLDCYPLPDAYTDRMTVAAYRARFGERLTHLERWTIADDAAPIDDRLSAHW